MRDPPDKTTVKEPLSLVNLSERSAVYLAKCTANSSFVSKTSTFFPAATAAAIPVDFTALQLRIFLLVEPTAENPFNLRERE